VKRLSQWDEDDLASCEVDCRRRELRSGDEGVYPWLCSGVNSGAAGFVDFGLGMDTVRRFTGSLLSRLGNVGSALSEVLPVLMLFVNDFLVVRYISWIGHDRL